MRKLPPVEEAKALMTEARDWSVWHWLMEKRRVRAAADRATDALEEMERKIKAEWSEDLRKAATNGRLRDVDPELKLALEDLKRAEKAAEASRLDAAARFDEAEQRLSATLAREGRERRSLPGNCAKKRSGKRQHSGEKNNRLSAYSGFARGASDRSSASCSSHGPPRRQPSSPVVHRRHTKQRLN